jgi:hypothetical protein
VQRLAPPGIQKFDRPMKPSRENSPTEQNCLRPKDPPIEKDRRARQGARLVPSSRRLICPAETPAVARYYTWQSDFKDAAI